MSKITYTFPADCPVVQLRGITVSGGEFVRLDGKWQQEPDAVRFGDTIEGKAIVARIAGKPELEAALAASHVEKQAVADRLAAIGWPQYQKVQSRAYNARAAYDRASEHGYPVTEARAMQVADEALAIIAKQYPASEAYAKAESYSIASNYAKAAAGRQTMKMIECGADPIIAIEAMEREWSAAAHRMVANS